MIRDVEGFGLETEEVYVFGAKELEEQDTIDDAIVRLQRLRRLSLDSVAMVISMCNSVEELIEAYQAKLAEELLMSPNYNTDEEIIHLEMLKSRFPEHTFNTCDVMIKDVAESKRMDRQIHLDDPYMDDNFHFMVLSRHYWPEREDTSPDMETWLGVSTYVSVKKRKNIEKEELDNGNEEVH